MRVGFVCTNYNNAAFTKTFVSSVLSNSSGELARIVVVDNQSAPQDIQVLEALAADHPEVEVVRCDSNLGYFPGLNVGLCRLRTRHPDIAHVVVGNNDLVFPADFIEKVRRHRDLLENWAVVAPDLVTPEGVHQNPHVVDPVGAFRRMVWDVHYAAYAAAKAIRGAAALAGTLVARRENDPNSRLHEQAGPVEQGYGACYLVGPAFFRHFNRLFAPTFLMQEEYFLYEQLRTIGQLTYYDPRFVVHHVGHSTTSRVPSRALWSFAREAHLQYKAFMRLSDEEKRARVDAFCKAPYAIDCAGVSA
jgi:GT2 family glycosyltransferase